MFTRISGYLVILLSFTSASSIAYSKTITIPNDAPTVQEAVQLAASGDEILIATEYFFWTKYDEYYWSNQTQGVIIENKDLTIKGANSETWPEQRIIYYNDDPEIEKRYASLLIRNSHVTLKYLRIREPMVGVPHYLDSPNAGYSVSPIIIDSGSLLISNCDINGLIECKGILNIQNSIFRGDARFRGYRSPDSSGYISTPSLRIGPGEHIDVVVEHSNILGVNSNPNEHVAIENATNSTLKIIKSTIEAGQSRNQKYTSAIQCATSENFQLILDNSQIIGGKGSEAEMLRGGNLLGPGNGSHGISFINTKASIIVENECDVAGGDGGNGVVHNNEVRHAGNGGHGLALYNSTIFTNQFHLENYITAQGGPGGEGMQDGEHVAQPGEAGVPIYLDEHSTIQPMSAIKHWSLY